MLPSKHCSEQVPSALGCAVLMDGEQILGGAGVLVQALPGGEPESVADARHALRGGAVYDFLAGGGTSARALAEFAYRRPLEFLGEPEAARYVVRERGRPHLRNRESTGRQHDARRVKVAFVGADREAIRLLDRGDAMGDAHIDAYGGAFDSAAAELSCNGSPRPWTRTSNAANIGIRCCTTI